MKGWAILYALALAGCSQPTSVSGDRIVSTNPCADAILVRLVAPDRIAAISHYSHDPSATSLPLEVARRYRSTAGTAEEVIALKPGLVLADSFAPAATLAAYRRAGLRVVVLDSPVTVAASIVQIRQVAAAAGERGKGEAMAEEIKRALSSTPSLLGEGDRHAQRDGGGAGRPAKRPSTLFYISGDLASGSGNLLDDLITRAGFRNAAADYGLRYSGTIPVEMLVARPPDVVISTGEGRSAALRRRLLPAVREAAFPRALINCGGPGIPPALARLRAIRASL